jgi:hypothetical protein
MKLVRSSCRYLEYYTLSNGNRMIKGVAVLKGQPCLKEQWFVLRAPPARFRKPQRFETPSHGGNKLRAVQRGGASSAMGRQKLKIQKQKPRSEADQDSVVSETDDQKRVPAIRFMW